jgi:uncharacterized membrane protein
MQELSRDDTLDTARGYAIFAMAASNLAGELLQLPHPFWVRVIGSTAAPLFVVIVGLLVYYSASIKTYSASYFWKRGLLTILVGALMDSLLWRYTPFLGVDVLYLSGLSMILAFYIARFNMALIIIITLSIFLLTPILQNTLGYGEFPTFIPLADELKNETGVVNPDFTLQDVFRHWTVDGWFPLFPWTGICFFGVILGRLRYGNKDSQYFQKFPKFIVYSIVVFCIAALSWNYETRMETRGSYSELFYPPTLAFLGASLSFSLFFIAVIDINPGLYLYTPFRILGESPLFMYILHFLLISKFAFPYFEKKRNSISVSDYLITLGLILLTCILVGLVLKWIRKKWVNKPFIVKFFIGS